MFPLRERQDFLPPEMQPFTFFVTQVLLTALVLPSGDAPSSAPLPVEEMLTPETRVTKFLSLLGEILETRSLPRSFVSGSPVVQACGSLSK